MTERFTRRQALQAAGAGALGMTAIGSILPDLARAADPSPRFAWSYSTLLIDRPPNLNDPTLQLLHVTQMYVGDKLGSRYDNWYLWVWTHDAPICRLYTMSRPFGPVTNRGLCSLPAPPAGYDASHFSSGDVVWDPQARLFYATPHGRRSDNSGQPTFLIKSGDGVNWSYVRTDPIVSPGTDTYDGYQTAYGRFLKDPYGNLRRVGGQALWFYRGERFNPHQYRVGLAVSSDMVNFSKYSPVPRFNPFNGGLFSIGSAFMANGRTYLVLSATSSGAAASGDGAGQATMYLKEANVPGSPYEWSDGPGVPIYVDPQSASFTDGGSYAIDPVDGRHWMAYANIGLSGTDLSTTGQQRWQVHTAFAAAA